MKKSLLLASTILACATTMAQAADMKVCVSWSNFREERWKTDEVAIKGALDAAGAEYISADWPAPRSSLVHNESPWV